MPADDPKNPSARNQTRVPLDAEVQLEFENFSGFLREVSANLSLGGIFVKTRYLKPVGTVVRFEFRLKDHYRLIRGTGEVVWTRWRDQPPAQPAGMGIQFVDLDAESRTLVAAIVDQHLRSGGAPFDLDPPPDPAGEESAARGASYAEGLPAKTGPALSESAMSEWLRDTPSSPIAGVDLGARAPEHAPEPEAADDQIQISFIDPPELPTASAPPVVDEAVPAAEVDPSAMGEAWATGKGWQREAAKQRPPQSARPLDWGAAEAMAALGIAPSGPVAAPPSRAPKPAAPLPPVEEGTEGAVLVPPEPLQLFGGGQAASARETSHLGLRVGLPLALLVLGALGWYYLPGRRAAEHAAVKVVENPAATRPAPTRPAVPAAVTREPAKAPTPVATPAHTPAPVPAPRPVVPVASAPVAAAAPVGKGFTAVERITWQSAGGETEVVLWTNGSVRAEDVEHVRLESSEPREVLKLRGVDRPFSPSQLAVGSAELRQIRVGFHEQKPNGQLHVVFDLATPETRVLSMLADGARLRVRLGRE